MQKIKFLVLTLLVVAVGFTGCKKDDGDDDAKANLVGKWALTKETWSSTVGSQAPQTGSDTDFDNDDYVYEFKSDNTYRVTEDGDLEDSGTYSIQNDGKKLVLNDSNEDQDENFTIKTLTSSQLVFTYEEIETEGGVTFKYSGEMTFKKL
ncbi:MAG: DUF5004 domain-containing protein [Sphingobacteriaceae bacterium]|nr:DUF5004 domain-containing protein [Sphingobacteriaceae bacterium]